MASRFTLWHAGLKPKNTKNVSKCWEFFENILWCFRSTTTWASSTVQMVKKSLSLCTAMPMPTGCLRTRIGKTFPYELSSAQLIDVVVINRNSRNSIALNCCKYSWITDSLQMAYSFRNSNHDCFEPQVCVIIYYHDKYRDFFFAVICLQKHGLEIEMKISMIWWTWEHCQTRQPHAMEDPLMFGSRLSVISRASHANVTQQEFGFAIPVS